MPESLGAHKLVKGPDTRVVIETAVLVGEMEIVLPQSPQCWKFNKHAYMAPSRNTLLHFI